MTLIWNTTGFIYGNCTLTASAEPVPGETNTTDNNVNCGLVMISIVGDAASQTAWCDGKVDMRDVGVTSKGFSATYYSSDGMYWHEIACFACPHSPNLDINNDLKIDMTDIGTVARHFGEHYP